MIRLVKLYVIGTITVFSLLYGLSFLRLLPHLSLDIQAKATLSKTELRVEVQTKPGAFVYVRVHPDIGSSTGGSYGESADHEGKRTVTYPLKDALHGKFEAEVDGYAYGTFFRSRGTHRVSFELPKRPYLELRSCEASSAGSNLSLSLRTPASASPFRCAVSLQGEIHVTLAGHPGTSVQYGSIRVTLPPSGSILLPLPLFPFLQSLPLSLLQSPETAFPTSFASLSPDKPSLSLDLPLFSTHETGSFELVFSLLPDSYNFRQLRDQMITLLVQGQPLPGGKDKKGLLFAHDFHSWEFLGKASTFADVAWLAVTRKEKSRSARSCGPYMGSFRYVPQTATDQRLEIYSRDGKKIDSKVFTARVSACPRVLRLWRRHGSAHVEPIDHSPDANEMKRWLAARFQSLQAAPPEARQE